MKSSKLAIILLAGLLLTGCDLLKTIRYSPSEKINLAYPYSESIAKGLAAISASALEERKKDVERELGNALDKRAKKCAGNFSPSWYESADTVRKKLQATNCLSEYDAQFARWVEFRRVGAILELPAPSPSSPSVAILTAESGMLDATFAEHSHRALVATEQTLEIFDFAQSRAMFSEAKPHRAHVGQLSPNGRLFTSFGKNGLRIRSAETGETLLELPKTGLHEFHWLDNRTAILEEDAAVKVFDFVSNTEIPVKELMAVTRAFRVGGTRDQYLVFSGNTVSKVEIRRKPNPEVLVTAQTSLEGYGWNLPSVSGATQDGKKLFHAYDDLILLAADTLATETVTFAPIHLTAATATSDPDKIYLSGFVPIDSKDPAHLRNYIFSIGNRTLSSVDTERVPPGPNELRVIYSPMGKKNLVFRARAGSMMVVSSLPSNDPVPLEEVRNNQRQLVNLAKIAAAEREEAAAERARYESGYQPRTIQAGRVVIAVPQREERRR